VADIGTFVSGLEGLAIPGVTMLDAEPVTAPVANVLPVAWIALPTIIGREPVTAMNSAIRPVAYRALLLVLVALARQREQKEYYAALLARAVAVQDALDAADTGFRLSYEIAVDKKLQAGSETFYGIAALVTGER
jgi:hypothetical protein